MAIKPKMYDTLGYKNQTKQYLMTTRLTDKAWETLSLSLDKSPHSRYDGRNVIDTILIFTKVMSATRDQFKFKNNWP
jgi:hypothetical protein